jgi:hypothetical protein
VLLSGYNVTVRITETTICKTSPIARDKARQSIDPIKLASRKLCTVEDHVNEALLAAAFASFFLVRPGKLLRSNVMHIRHLENHAK